MTTRAERKDASLRRILDAAAVRLRVEGLSGAAVVPVMRDAGLTHGAFYAHFDDKEALLAAAFRHALKDNRLRWVGAPKPESWGARLARLARRYLTVAHRDDPADGCAFAAAASEAGRASENFRTVFQEELIKSLHAVCAGAPGDPTPDPPTPDPPAGSVGDARWDEAVAMLALCVGGVVLARATADPAFSDRILAACAAASDRLTPDRPAPDRPVPDHCENGKSENDAPEK